MSFIPWSGGYKKPASVYQHTVENTWLLRIFADKKEVVISRGAGIPMEVISASSDSILSALCLAVQEWKNRGHTANGYWEKFGKKRDADLIYFGAES